VSLTVLILVLVPICAVLLARVTGCSTARIGRAPRRLLFSTIPVFAMSLGFFIAAAVIPCCEDGSPHGTVAAFCFMFMNAAQLLDAVALSWLRYMRFCCRAPPLSPPLTTSSTRPPLTQ
jgi:hypothetical protein